VHFVIDRGVVAGVAGALQQARLLGERAQGRIVGAGIGRVARRLGVLCALRVLGLAFLALGRIDDVGGGIGRRLVAERAGHALRLLRVALQRGAGLLAAHGGLARRLVGLVDLGC